MVENMFKGGNSLNNYQKDSDISIKFNGEKQTILKKDESFEWILPEGKTDNDKIVMFEDFQKKKSPIKKEKLTSMSKKNAEIFLLIFFAIIIGGLFGTSMLSILPEVSEQSNDLNSVQFISVSLEPINVYVEQEGVFSEISSAESVSKELSPSVILKRDKYYIIKNISESNQNLSKQAYVKQISTSSLSIDEIDKLEGESMVAVRTILSNLVASNITEEMWKEIDSQRKLLLDNSLSNSAINAIELMKQNNNSIESKQAILQLFVNYDEFVTNYQI